MAAKNLDEILKSYEELKEYTNKFDDSRLNELMADFEQKFIPYVSRHLKKGGGKMKKKKLLLFVDGGPESKEALKKLKKAGITNLEIYDIRKGNGADFSPPLLLTGDGRYDSLESIKRYAEIRPKK